MRTLPITESRDPRYQTSSQYDHLTISEMVSDDEGEGCIINGEYLFAEGEEGSDNCIIYRIDDFILIPKTTGYFPVISPESKKEVIVDILKTRHGRNVNFV